MQAPVITSSTRSSIRPGSWAAWRVALRPTTLWIATVPVLVATCLAWSAVGAFDAVERADHARGVGADAGRDEPAERRRLHRAPRRRRARASGLPRATANGWLSPRAVKRAIVATIVVAAILALPLMLRWRLAHRAHRPRVDARRLRLHGRTAADRLYAVRRAQRVRLLRLIAVCGTYYVQTGEIGPRDVDRRDRDRSARRRRAAGQQLSRPRARRWQRAAARCRS